MVLHTQTAVSGMPDHIPPHLPLSELILPCALIYPSNIMYTPDHIPPPFLNSFCPVPWPTPPILCTFMAACPLGQYGNSNSNMHILDFCTLAKMKYNQ